MDDDRLAWISLPVPFPQQRIRYPAYDVSRVLVAQLQGLHNRQLPRPNGGTLRRND